MMDSSVPSAQPAIEQIDDQPNLFMGLIGGGVAMLVGALIWGAITYFTGYQIGYVAIGVGFLVGVAIRYFGKGKSPIFGISGAVLSLIGCLLGNLLVYSGLIAREEGASFMEVLFFLVVNPAALIEVFTIAFEFLDLVFYALAVYVGFSTAMDIKRARR